MKAYKLDDEKRAIVSKEKKKLNVFRKTSCVNKSLQRTKKVKVYVRTYVRLLFKKIKSFCHLPIDYSLFKHKEYIQMLMNTFSLYSKKISNVYIKKD